MVAIIEDKVEAAAGARPALNKMDMFKAELRALRTAGYPSGEALNYLHDVFNLAVVEHNEAVREWEARVVELHQRFRTRVANRRADRFEARENRALRTLAVMPAVTLAGVAAKAGCFEDEVDFLDVDLQNLCRSVMHDLSVVGATIGGVA